MSLTQGGLLAWCTSVTQQLGVIEVVVWSTGGAFSCLVVGLLPDFCCGVGKQQRRNSSMLGEV